MDWARMGSWKLGRVLGRGACGVVRIATAKDDEFHQVAMKIVDVNPMGRVFMSTGIGPEESQQLMLNESQTLSLLDHPNIVRLECTFLEEYYLISCLEYIEGDDLYSYVTKYALDVKVVQQLFRQLCSAVSYCHSQMIMHGDLKCENVLIRKCDRCVKVIDFGFSQRLREKNGVVEARGRTTQYSPPYDPNLTFAWDSWSAGVILYVMLTQRFPFSLNQLLTGQMENMVEIAKKVTDGQIFELLMGLWELDYRRRTLIVDLMSESPWLRETETQQDRKDMTSTTTSPSFSKDHSVHLPSSCSSLKYPSLLELPPPIVSSSCTPPSCFGRNETLSFPQTVSSPILDFATSGSPVRERDQNLRITKEERDVDSQEQEVLPSNPKKKGKKKAKQKWIKEFGFANKKFL